MLEVVRKVIVMVIMLVNQLPRTPGKKMMLRKKTNLDGCYGV